MCLVRSPEYRQIQVLLGKARGLWSQPKQAGQALGCQLHLPQCSHSVAVCSSLANTALQTTSVLEAAFSCPRPQYAGMASGSCQVSCHLGFKQGLKQGSRIRSLLGPNCTGWAPPPPAQLVNKAMKYLLIWKRLALCGGDHGFCFP